MITNKPRRIFREAYDSNLINLPHERQIKHVTNHTRYNEYHKINGHSKINSIISLTL